MAAQYAGRNAPGRPARLGRRGIVGVSIAVANYVWGTHATEFLATGTAIGRLADEHKLPDTTPRPRRPGQALTRASR
jgi:hypothetical protein